MLKVFQSSLLQKFPKIDHGFFGTYEGLLDDYLQTNSDLPLEKIKALYMADYCQLICTYFNVPFNHFMHLKQVHGAKVIIVDKPFANDEIIEADAFVTSYPGLVLSIQTADCVPLLLYDSKNHLCAAIHSGWKGTLENIVLKTVQTMVKQGASLENISVAIGPCIHQENFEVEAHFKPLFEERDLTWGAFFKAGKDQDHVWFDLPGLVKAQLQKSGIQYIDDIGIDTYLETENFSSYRRACHQKHLDPRRQLSAIKLNQYSSIILKNELLFSGLST